jgi:hypothetical protein
VGFRVIERLGHLYERLPIEFSAGTRLLLTILASEVIEVGDRGYIETGTAVCEPKGERLRRLTGLDRSSIQRSFNQIGRVCICDRPANELCQGRGIVFRRYHREDDEYTLNFSPDDVARLHVLRIVLESAPAVASCESQPASCNLRQNRAQVAPLQPQVATSHLLITTEETEERQSPATAVRQADPAVISYSEAYQLRYGLLPVVRRGDYVQLAELRRHLGVKTPDTPLDWEKAIANYFASARSSHTLADLCTQYATYRMHRLDRFNQPIGAETNGRYHKDGSNDKGQTQQHRLSPRPYRPKQ